MPEQYEVKVIFECDRKVLDRIGHHEDPEIRRQQREIGLIDHQDRLTLLGLYTAEHVENFICVEESKEAKRRIAARQKAEREARDREMRAREIPVSRASDELRAKWEKTRDSAPETLMTKKEMSQATGISYSAIRNWSLNGFFRGEKDIPREVLTRYLEYRYRIKSDEVTLSKKEEAELAEILQETGV